MGGPVRHPRVVERFAGSLKFEGAAEPATAEERLGVDLGQKVLGEDILGHLTESFQQRTLLIRLPAPQADPLAAAFARMPWELARPAPGEPRLLDRNLVVRAATAGSTVTEATTTLSLEGTEPAEQLADMMDLSETRRTRRCERRRGDSRT